MASHLFCCPENRECHLKGNPSRKKSNTKKSSNDLAGNGNDYWVFKLYEQNGNFKHVKTSVAI